MQSLQATVEALKYENSQLKKGQESQMLALEQEVKSLKALAAEAKRAAQTEHRQQQDMIIGLEQKVEEMERAAQVKVLQDSKHLQAHHTARQEPKVDVDAIVAPYNYRIANMRA